MRGAGIFIFWVAAMLAILCALGALQGGVTPASAQAQFDRPGGDYRTEAVRSGDPVECAQRCERDRRCRAWSFSYPGPHQKVAICRLKNSVPSRVENNCCVSGIRGAGVIERRTGPIEMSTDRHGGDYRSFELTPDVTGEACKDACESDNKCRAWTYVRPGYIGGSARCFLKSHIKPPRRKPCCISGVVR